MLMNIPEELRKLNQWVCAGPDKTPINPRTRKAADPTDPTTWSSFQEAVAAGYKHVGFVLHKNDPFTIIDLDPPESEEQWLRHQKILGAIDSYTERSQSGNGYHIIVMGSIPAGRRRDKVEVYSDSRYMICTGNVTKFRPVKNCQEILDLLYSEMATTVTIDLEDREAIQTDTEVVDMAMRAVNADKFNSLCNGDMSGYPSQSEADFALLSMFAFYSPDNEQVRRLFRMSALGKRDKAQRNNTYIDFALGKIRGQLNTKTDLSAFKERAEAAVQPVEEIKTPDEAQVSIFPPGLVGEVADYIYRSAIRPIPEVALAASLTLFAGIVGRQFNLSSTGLNLYTILLAKTGMGKEGAASGINRLLKEVRAHVPMVDQFRGPASFASGPALVKSLVEKPCQFSILGEFGIYLKQMCGPRAFGPLILLKRAFLDLYHKSGWNEVLMGTEYSDKEKNTGMVAAPCLTLLGESTPETFLEGLDDQMIRDGLIPRFLFIEYLGTRPYINPNAGFPPDPCMVKRLGDMVASVLQMGCNNTCVMVDYSPEARAMADAFERKATDRINGDHVLGFAEIWNRAHLKAIKLAAIVAIGMGHHSPVIAPHVMQWAIQVAERDATVLLARFEKGDLGEGDGKQLADIRKVIKAYYTKKPAASYRVPDDVHKAGFIPYRYLLNRTGQLSSFANSRVGSTASLNNSLKVMIDSGELLEVDRITLQNKFSLNQRVFALGAEWNEK